ncbi:helix-turn-helix domain-containing protein [Nocardia sp. NPDC059246]|uniref:helix-turn-helix domain-containing protein n=1 Tax=unclassified Nocardia TaxID=2637762 RepID=UPI00367C2BAA
MTRSRSSLKVSIKSTPEGAPLVTLQEAAKTVSVTERTVRNWISNGLLTGYRFGPKIIRVDREELLALATPVNGQGVA